MWPVWRLTLAAIPSGRYAGVVPSGSTYILTLAAQVRVPTAGYSDDTQQQVHVTVLDGRAYYYQICEPREISRRLSVSHASASRRVSKVLGALCSAASGPV